MLLRSPTSTNDRLTPDGKVESFFREQVRNLLGLDWSARDDKIYDELRRLKKLDSEQAR